MMLARLSNGCYNSHTMEPKIKMSVIQINRLVNRHYKFSREKFDCRNTEFFDDYGYTCSVVNGLKYKNHDAILKEIRYRSRGNILQTLMNDLHEQGKLKAGEYWIYQ